MNQALSTLRLAKPADAQAIAELHIASIRHYCQDHYPPDVIEDWVRPIKAEDYRALPSHNIIMVAEQSGGIVGFGVLNLDKEVLDKLYIAPGSGGQRIGSALLNELESIACSQGIEALSLSATLNAIAFYEHKGYQKKSLTPAACAKDNLLGCISMAKHLGIDAL